jgi:hypothetical protein
MKTFLAASLLVLTSLLQAQVSIESSDFPASGDTAMVSISADVDLDYASTGADFVWDYSMLNFTTQRIDTFFDIDDASFTYQLVFNNGWLDPDYQADYYTPYTNFVIPTSDLFELPLSNPVNFTKIEDDRVEIVGVGVELSGLQVPIKNEPVDKVYELPLNFTDSWISNSFFEIDLNPAYDGILRRYQERTTEVDGWGTVTTPFGTFEVVRTKATIDFTDSLKIVLGETETWFELPTPTQVVYSWWAKDQKIPVLEVVSQITFGTETVTSVEYKDRDWSDLSTGELDFGTVTIYPNPTSDMLYISANAPIDKLTVYNLTGQQVLQVSNTQEINVETLERGLYIIQITAGHQTTVQEFVRK